MRIGLIARMDNTGLGIQTWEFFRHMQPAKTMVIDFSAYKKMRQYPDRYDYPGAVWVMTIPTPQQIEEFLDDIDVVFTAEIPYSYLLVTRAKERGIPMLIQPNYEFSGWLSKKNLPRPDVFGLPSKWHYDDFPEPKIYLPVPIATERFKPTKHDSAKSFLHVVGNPAANDRNGTRDLLKALKLVKSPINITISCLVPRHVEDMLRGQVFPRNVKIVTDTTSPDYYWQLYEGHDVLVMPRRYGGLCLPANEAIGANMPVIMPDVSPNNEWLPKAWLTKAEHNFMFGNRAVNNIEVFMTAPEVLAAKIDEFAQPEFFQSARTAAAKLAEQNSWSKLKGLYIDTFETMIKNKNNG